MIVYRTAFHRQRLRGRRRGGLRGLIRPSTSDAAETSRCRSAGPSPRIAVLGAFGIDNFGNDATLRVMLDALRRRRLEASVLCICSAPTRVAEEHGLDCRPLHFHAASDSRLLHSRFRLVRQATRLPFELRRWFSMCRSLGDVDRLIVPGTGILDDQHSRATGAPLDLLLWCLAARFRKVPVAMVSVGAGPIRSRLSRVLLRAAAGCTSWISYRDQESLDYMRSIGRRTGSDRLSVDLVFGLTYPSVKVGGPPRVGIGVLSEVNWLGRRDDYLTYLSRMAKVVRSLVNDGFGITLLIGDLVDQAARSDLVALLDDQRAALHLPADETYADVVTTLRTCCVVVASRYHSLVPALCLGIPTISLEYGFKNTALLTRFNLAHLCHDIDDFEPEVIVTEVSGAAISVDTAELIAQGQQLRRGVDAHLTDLLAASRPSAVAR